MAKHVKLKPFVSAGEVFLAPDGKVYKVALSLFPLKDNRGVALRVGNTVYFFNEDGSYDGPEMKADRGNIEQLTSLLAECAENKSGLPSDTYFEPGCAGYEAETAIWSERPSKGEA